MDQICYGAHHQRSTYIKTYRLCELNAIEIFLDATKFFQDKVYSRTADLLLVNIIKADLFCTITLCYIFMEV